MSRKPLLIAGLVLLALSLILNVIDHHGHGMMSLPGFMFLFGIAGGALLTVFAKIILYRLIGRKGDYYEKGDWVT